MATIQKINELDFIKEKLKSPAVINSKIEFYQALNFFTRKTKKDMEDRKTLYEEYRQSKQLENISQAKWAILKNIFSNYFLLQMENAKNLANKNLTLEAQDIITELKKLQPIFNINYDVSNFFTWATETDSKLNEISFTAIFENLEFGERAISNLQNTIFSNLQSGPVVPGVKDKKEYLNKLLEHPLLYCLNPYQQKYNFAQNLKNKVINLGHYHELAVALLELKMGQKLEKIDALILYLINEDISKGFNNIINSEANDDAPLKKLLEKINSNKKLINNDFEELSTFVQKNKSLNHQVVQREMRENETSNASLQDGSVITEMTNGEKTILNIHTATDKGQNQRNQQANTLGAMTKFGDTLGVSGSMSVTICDNHIITTDTNGYFKESKETIERMSDFQKYFMTAFQFDSSFVSYINNLSSKNENFDITKSFILSENFSLIRKEKYMSVGIDVLRQSLEHHDGEIISSKCKEIMIIINDYKTEFAKILQGTSSDNAVQFQLLHEPLLTFIQSVLSLQLNKGIQFFSPQDYDNISFIYENSIKCTSNKIHESCTIIKMYLEFIKQRSDYNIVFNNDIYRDVAEVSLLKKENEEINLFIPVITANPSPNTKTKKGYAFRQDHTHSSNVYMNNIVNHFSEYPDQIPRNGKRIRKSINEFIENNTKHNIVLKNAIQSIEDFEDLKKLDKEIVNSISIKTTSYSASNDKHVQYLTKLVSPIYLEGAAYNNVKTDDKKNKDMLLANLFCLYAATYGIVINCAYDSNANLNSVEQDFKNAATNGLRIGKKSS